jgi:hypothetical protein
MHLFLSSWRSNVPVSKILDLQGSAVSIVCLQIDTMTLTFDLEKQYASSFYYDELQDSEAYGSVSILPIQGSSVKLYYKLDL